MIKLFNLILEKLNLTEYSKNDAIPEIARMKKDLCVFTFGPPAAGKSTFVKNFILRLNNNFSIVNPDNIDYILRQKDYKKMRPSGVTRLSIKRAQYILNSGQNMIYDTTGNDFDRISSINKIARDNKYTVVFIHLIDSLNDLIKKASSRERPTDIEYLKASYGKTQNLISKFYNELKPDSYYVVTTSNNQYKFYKYEDGKLLKKKGDIYR